MHTSIPVFITTSVSISIVLISTRQVIYDYYYRSVYPVQEIS